MTRTAARIGPNSRASSLAKVDGRTREAHLLRQVRSELTAHVGGKPSATQRMLIERAAVLALRVGMLDRKIMDDGMAEHASRTYLAWSNSLTRTLRELGLDETQDRPGNRLQQHLASKAA